MYFGGNAGDKNVQWYEVVSTSTKTSTSGGQSQVGVVDG